MSRRAGASGFRRAALHRGQRGVAQILAGRHPTDRAVGDLAAEFVGFRAERGRHHGNAGDRGGQRGVRPIDGALELDGARLQQRLGDGHVLAQRGERRSVVSAEHRSHSADVAGADSEAEAIAGELSRDLRLLGRRDGMASPNRNDAGAEQDALRSGRGGGHQRHAVEIRAAHREPCGVDAALLAILDALEHGDAVAAHHGQSNRLFAHTLLLLIAWSLRIVYFPYATLSAGALAARPRSRGVWRTRRARWRLRRAGRRRRR